MKIHPTVKSLLDDIERYCRLNGISRTAFSRDVTGDGHLVRRMHLGVKPTLNTIDRINKHLNGARICRPRGRRK